MSVDQLKKEMVEANLDLEKIFGSINKGVAFNSEILCEFLCRYDKMGKWQWRGFDKRKTELLVERIISSRGEHDRVSLDLMLHSLKYNH